MVEGQIPGDDQAYGAPLDELTKLGDTAHSELLKIRTTATLIDDYVKAVKGKMTVLKTDLDAGFQANIDVMRNELAKQKTANEDLARSVDEQKEAANKHEAEATKQASRAEAAEKEAQRLLHEAAQEKEKVGREHEAAMQKAREEREEALAKASKERDAMRTEKEEQIDRLRKDMLRSEEEAKRERDNLNTKVANLTNETERLMQAKNEEAERHGQTRDTLNSRIGDLEKTVSELNSKVYEAEAAVRAGERKLAETMSDMERKHANALSDAEYDAKKRLQESEDARRAVDDKHRAEIADLKEQERRTAQENEERLASLERKHAAAADAARSESEHRVSRLEKDVEDLAAQNSKAIADLEETWKKRMEDADEYAKGRLDRVQRALEDAEGELARKTEIMAEKEKEAEQTRDGQVKALTSSYEVQIGALTSDLERSREALAKLQEETKEQLDTMKARHDAELEELKGSHSKALERAVEDRASRLQETEDRLRRENEAEVKAARRAHDDELLQQKKTLEKAMEDMESSHNKIVGHMRDEYEGLLGALRKEHQAQLEAEKEASRNVLSSSEDTLSNQVRELSSMLDDERKAVQRLKAEVAETTEKLDKIMIQHSDALRALDRSEQESVEMGDQISTLTKVVQTKSSEVVQLEEDLNKVRRDFTALETKSADYRQTIAELTGKSEELDRLFKEAVEKYRQEMDQKDSEIAHQREALQTAIRAAEQATGMRVDGSSPKPSVSIAGADHQDTSAAGSPAAPRSAATDPRVAALRGTPQAAAAAGTAGAAGEEDFRVRSDTVLSRKDTMLHKMGVIREDKRERLDEAIAFLKSEVMPLTREGVKILDKTLRKLENSIGKQNYTGDPGAMFKQAQISIKREVVAVAGEQIAGEEWSLSADDLEKFPKHSLNSLFRSMQELCVMYDSLPDDYKNTMLTAKEIVNNSPLLLALCRYIKENHLSSTWDKMRITNNAVHAFKQARAMKALEDHNVSVGTSSPSPSPRSSVTKL